ncbi:glycosyltransferase [Paludibaculum fermentans]|uniref:Glycosyltransferase family 2 protein n=1 Tax=Paludibaculum fermentans TaxID=1473598 RepID=A0A7S7NWG7_PALFE|nr:glycosyltransferase [Paludibaculum fermentans]QOY91047.1 hypothetical protein IRI77_14205 [Paludibaculum fermentans]
MFRSRTEESVEQSEAMPGSVPGGSMPPRVCILTPVKDATPHLDRYFECLLRLDYPRERLSLGLLESDSTDGTLLQLQSKLSQLQPHFKSARVWNRNFGFHLPDGVPRWAPSQQLPRRAALARSRNYLASVALGDADWALWIDVDLVDYPPDVLNRLLATRKDIVHPHCVKVPGGRSFDWNAWKDQQSLLMHDLRGRGELVELDSVGGTMLLVRADLHREGLIFPPFPYGRLHPKARRRGGRALGWLARLAGRLVPGEIETEGFAMMAHDMGVPCWGMPQLEVRHKDA